MATKKKAKKTAKKKKKKSDAEARSGAVADLRNILKRIIARRLSLSIT